jgi:hypothetical protein
MGYGDAAPEVQDRYLAKDYDGAAAAVPFEFVDSTSLLGPVDRIAHKMGEFAAAGVTNLAISPFGWTTEEKMGSLDVAMQALQKSGVA